MDYSLLEKCESIGKNGRKTLSKKTVSIIGVGGMGSTVAQILVRNGITIRIIDKDRVVEKDMPRQTLYLLEDISKFKAKHAKKRLEEIKDNIKVKTFHEELNEDNMFLVEADLIIDASNNHKTTLLLNQFALEKKIPLITGRYSGHKGHVFIVDKHQFKKGACVHCLDEKLNLPAISDIGVHSPIATVIGALVANAAIKNLLDLDNIDTLLSVDLMKTEIRRSKVEKIRNCKHCKGK